MLTGRRLLLVNLLFIFFLVNNSPYQLWNSFRYICDLDHDCFPPESRHSVDLHREPPDGHLLYSIPDHPHPGARLLVLPGHLPAR